jgi:hypothetical protein
MNIQNISTRVNELLMTSKSPNPPAQGWEAFIRGTASVVNLAYGTNHVNSLRLESELIAVRSDTRLSRALQICTGYLHVLRSELDNGLIGEIRNLISGEVLGSFVLLAKEVLQDGTEASDHVGSVLVAAVYEDTIRRIAELAGLDYEEKLELVISSLKKGSVLSGSTPSAAQGLLNFRNNALHARWDKVSRSETDACLAFVQGLLQAHFD